MKGAQKIWFLFLLFLVCQTGYSTCPPNCPDTEDSVGGCTQTGGSGRDPISELRSTLAPALSRVLHRPPYLDPGPRAAWGPETRMTPPDLGADWVPPTPTPTRRQRAASVSHMPPPPQRSDDSPPRRRLMTPPDLGASLLPSAQTETERDENDFKFAKAVSKAAEQVKPRTDTCPRMPFSEPSGRAIFAMASQRQMDSQRLDGSSAQREPKKLWKNAIGKVIENQHLVHQLCDSGLRQTFGESATITHAEATTLNAVFVRDFAINYKEAYERGEKPQPPYKEGTLVSFVTTNQMIPLGTFVRVHVNGIGPNGKDDPKASGMLGSWLVRRTTVLGKTPEQIKEMLQLPQVPTHITDMTIPAGAQLIRSTVGAVQYKEGDTKGEDGGLQYQLVERIDRDHYRSLQPLTPGTLCCPDAQDTTGTVPVPRPTGDGTTVEEL